MTAGGTLHALLLPHNLNLLSGTLNHRDRSLAVQIIFLLILLRQKSSRGALEAAGILIRISVRYSMHLSSYNNNFMVRL